MTKSKFETDVEERARQTGVIPPAVGARPETHATIAAMRARALMPKLAKHRKAMEMKESNALRDKHNRAAEAARVAGKALPPTFRVTPKDTPALAAGLLPPGAEPVNTEAPEDLLAALRGEAAPEPSAAPVDAAPRARRSKGEPTIPDGDGGVA